MFPKSYRLPLRKEPDFFLKAQHTPQRYFSWYVLPSQNWQVAVVVSKKTAQLSVVRHAVKRRVSAALLPLIQKNAQYPLRIVIVVKRSALTVSPQELSRVIEQEMNVLLKKVVKVTGKQ